ncbi:hypothetical protein [Thomasclavelia cocleata]|uniref:hypothetical protein n=1 Tax=Thomasclavelia cocleata TaxID=69824 RepID=UPI002577BE31|nr:hypothetical protein [Thomasclavelia cocleata]
MEDIVEKSPRILRPDTIIVKNAIGEIDFKASYLETEIKYVRVDASYGIKQSKRGVDSDDNAVFVIDLNDLIAAQDGETAEYVDADNFNKESGTFTLSGGDTVIFNNHEYTVNKVNIKRNISGIPVFIEGYLK